MTKKGYKDQPSRSWELVLIEALADDRLIDPAVPVRRWRLNEEISAVE